MSVEDVYTPKPRNLTDVKTKEQIDEVQKTANHIKVIDETINTADKLAGGPTYRQEIKEKDEERQNLMEENKKLREQLNKAELETVKTELGSKIDQLSQSLKQGASRQTISEEITDIKKTATELGLGGSKVSELKEMLSLVNSFRPEKGLAEQVKEAKELIDTLEPQKEKPSSSGTPPEILLQIEKNRSDTAIKLEEMANARAMQQQNFELDKIKWQEERDLRREQIQAQLAIEKERNELISGGIKRLGSVFARATIESGGPSSSLGSQVIEAGEGDFGEFTCPTPGCGQTIAIARDATKAICPNCSTVYPIQRIAKEPGIEAET